MNGINGSDEIINTRTKWLCWDIHEQCEKYLRLIKESGGTEDPPLSRQRIWNPRDSYGIKSR